MRNTREKDIKKRQRNGSERKLLNHHAKEQKKKNK